MCVPVEKSTERAELVRRLGAGLEKRRALPGGAAREGLDGHLVSLLEKLRNAARRPVRVDRDIEAPRTVALSIALALYTQPHIARTFVDPARDEGPPGDAAVTIPPDTARVALDLQPWELDDLRDDIDRRASEHLKQRRCAKWLWNHWGALDPGELFRRLFPGATGRVDVQSVGGQMYVAVDAAASVPPMAILMPWFASDDDGALPLDAFAGRYADGALRDNAGRSIGSSKEEIVFLLDRMVALLPRSGRDRFTKRDQWRSTGAAALTTLAASYARGHRLHRPLPPDAVSLEGWLAPDDGRVRLGDCEGIFDQVVLSRSADVMRLAVAAMLSRPWVGETMQATVEDLQIYDVAAHLRAAIEPILQWTQSPHTAGTVARFLRLPTHQVAPVLDRIHTRWTKRSARWLRAPTTEEPWVPIARLTDFLARISANLQGVISMPELEQPHRDVAILYVAHRVAGASDRDMLPVDPELPGLPEGLSDVFWGVWEQLFGDSDNPGDITWDGAI